MINSFSCTLGVQLLLFSILESECNHPDHKWAPKLMRLMLDGNRIQQILFVDIRNYKSVIQQWVYRFPYARSSQRMRGACTFIVSVDSIKREEEIIET